MKTPDDNFDELLRRKLNGVSVKPDNDFFDSIIPVKQKNNRAFWFWLSAIVVLFLVGGITYYLSDKEVSIHKKSYSHATQKEPINASNTVKNTLNTDQTNITNENHETSEISNALNSTPANSNSSTEQNSLISSRSLFDSGTINSRSKKKKQRNVEYGVSPSRFVNETKSNQQMVYMTYYHLMDGLPTSNLNHPSAQIMTVKKMEFQQHEISKWMLDIGAGVVYGTSNFKSATNDSAMQRLVGERNKFSNNSGLYLSARLNYKWKNNLSLFVESSLTKKSENFNFNFTEYVSQLNVDTTIYFILFPFTSPVQVTEYDSTIINSTRQHEIHQAINISRLSFTTGISYRHPIGRFVVEPNAGIQFNLLTALNGSGNLNHEFRDQDASNYYSTKTTLGLEGGMKINYLLSESLNAFIHSSYCFNPFNINAPGTIYNQKTQDIKFGAGISYLIFKRQAAKVNLKGSDIVMN